MKSKLLIIFVVLVFMVLSFIGGMIYIASGIEISIENEVYIPKENEIKLIRNARRYLNSKDSVAVTYFCSGFEKDKNAYIVQFSNDCGNVTVDMPGGFSTGRYSMCLSTFSVKLDTLGKPIEDKELTAEEVLDLLK